MTAADELFRHLSAERSGDPAVKEALRYREALLRGFTLLNRLDRCSVGTRLKALAEIGVLREKALGRKKLFVHEKLLGLLTSEEHTWERYG